MRRCPHGREWLSHNVSRPVKHIFKQTHHRQPQHVRKFSRYTNILNINELHNDTINQSSDQSTYHSNVASQSNHVFENNRQYEEEMYNDEDATQFAETYTRTIRSRNEPSHDQDSMQSNHLTSADHDNSEPFDELNHQLVDVVDEAELLRMNELSEFIIQSMNEALEHDEFSQLVSRLQSIDQFKLINAESILTHLYDYSRQIHPSKLSGDAGKRVLRVLHLLIHTFKPFISEWSAQTFDSSLYVANRVKSPDHVRWLFNQLINSSHRPNSRHWSWLIHTYQSLQSAVSNRYLNQWSNNISVVTIMQSINSWNSLCVASHRILVDAFARSICFDACLLSGELNTATEFIYDMLSFEAVDQSTQMATQLKWGEQAKMIEIFARQSHWEQVISIWHAMAHKPSYTTHSISQSVYQTLNDPITIKLAYNVAQAYDRLGYHSHVIGLYDWLMTSAHERCFGTIWQWGPTFISLLISNLIKCGRFEQVCLVGDVLLGRMSADQLSLADQVTDPEQIRDLQLDRLKRDEHLFNIISSNSLTPSNSSFDPLSSSRPITTCFSGETFEMLASFYNTHFLYSHTVSMYQLVGPLMNDPAHESSMKRSLSQLISRTKSHSLTPQCYTLVIHALAKVKLYSQMEQLLLYMSDTAVKITPEMLAELVKAIPQHHIHRRTQKVHLPLLYKHLNFQTQLHFRAWEFYNSFLNGQVGDKLINNLLASSSHPRLTAQLETIKQRRQHQLESHSKSTTHTRQLPASYNSSQASS